MKRFMTVFITLLASLILVACGSEGGSSDQEILKVGILHSAEHKSLSDAEAGLKEAMLEAGYVEGETIEFNTLNSQGDASNLNDMANQLAKDNDILVGVSTSSAQALANVESEKPILFTATTDPVGAGLIESMESPGANITGTSDAAPIEEQISLLLSINPDAERVGIIYNSSEQNSQVQAAEARQAIESHGKEVVEMTVTSTNDVQQVATSLLNDVDLLYIPTDNTLSAAADTVGQLAIDAQVPVVAGSIDHVEVGALATYGISYFDLGRQTGDMAVDIAKNDKKPADIPAETAKELELFVNEDFAAALGIDPATISLD